MKREELTTLNIPEETVETIMNLHGADIEGQKATVATLTAERDNYKGQLATAQSALKSFEGVDVADLQGKIAHLTTDLGKKETDYQQKLADMSFSSLLQDVIGTSKGKNAKAITALLDLDSLKNSKNQTDDVKTAIEALKTDNDYLFESDTPAPQFGASTPGAQPSAMDAIRSAAGLKNHEN